MDHDRLFKELLTTFFAEFIELFFPELYQLLELSQEVVFLDKEMFSDIGLGERREADLVARVRMRGGEAYFLVHLEPQAQPVSAFAKRLFGYFVRLSETHNLPVYPVAIFSFGRPLGLQASSYHVHFPNLKVLDFRFASLQLNRLNWKDFVDRPNPVASALMARMKIAHQDRPRVKLQCLRLLATLRLNAAKSALIARFVDSYLRLRGEELLRFEQALEATPGAERQKIMHYTTSWEEQGLKKGRKEGRKEGIKDGRRDGLVEGLQTALRVKFGQPAEEALSRLEKCDVAGLRRIKKRLLAGKPLGELF